MANFKTISATCDALFESARNIAQSAGIMHHTAAVMRENAARLDAVNKRLQEALGTNRKIAERMDEVIRSCREARETLKRSVAALHRANVEVIGQRVEQSLTPPRSAIGHLAEWVSGPESPLDLRSWNPSGEPH